MRRKKQLERLIDGYSKQIETVLELKKDKDRMLIELEGLKNTVSDPSIVEKCIRIVRNE